MKTVLLIKVLLVLSFFSFTNPARAELVDREGLIILGGGLGLHLPRNGEMHEVYRSGFHYYVKGGVGLTSHLSATAEFAEARYRVALAFKDLDARTYLYHSFLGGMRWNMVAGAYIVPYAEGLFGVTRFKYAKYIDPYESTVAVGYFPIAVGSFGAEFFMGPNWCVEGSVKLYRVFGDVYLQPDFPEDQQQPHNLTGETFKPLGFWLGGGFLVFL